MKILIPIIGFAPTGGYRVLSELANHWINDGKEVDFLVNEAFSNPHFPTKAKIIQATNFGSLINDDEITKRRPRKLHGLLNLFGMSRALRQIGKKYDVILANHSLTAWPIALSRCGYAKKFYYIQAYEPEYYKLESGLKSKVAGWLSRKSYEFNLIQICNAEVYINYANIKAQDWVPPGINFDIFYPRQAPTEFRTAKEIILGCIGRREPAKGIKYVLDAFENLYLKDQRFRLHVAFGNLPSDWTHSAMKIIMPENDDELSDFYRSLDIMLAPGTVQHGAPHYPVMEAMACGVPVVNTGYLPADSENSWIANTHSSDSIVSAVNEIVADRQYLSKVIKAKSDIARFRWEVVSAKMMNIFIKHVE